MIKHRWFDEDASLQTELATLIKERKLIPVFGSGFTKGCQSKQGIVPSGDDMKMYMKTILSKKYGMNISDFERDTFTTLCTGFDKRTSVNEKFEYFSNNFTKVKILKNKIDFLSIDWPYVYTLNIDDGIENNVRYEVILPKKDFYNKYVEEYNSVFKIHGDVHTYLKYINDEENKEDIIFNKKQYIDSLKNNKAMLAKFEEDFGTNNILYIGCSLDDEPDLLSVVSLSLKNNKTHREIFYLSSTELSKKAQDNLEDYGITTCIVIKDYDTFYSSIVEKVKSIKKDKYDFIDFYKEPRINVCDSKQSHLDFMLTSDNLIPSPYKRELYKPHFFIERDIVLNNVLEDLKFRSPIHIIYGHRISGKTYCLFGLYENIKDKERYFFPSNTLITDIAINNLLLKSNCAFFFDTQVLTQNQLTKILDSKRILLENKSYAITCINTSDRYAVSLIANNFGYKTTPLKNVFSREESTKINSIFEESNMPRFGFVEKHFDKIKNRNITKYSTILDNLFKIASVFGKSNKNFTFPNVSEISDEQSIAIIILLATQQAITSYDMYYFDIVKECTEFSEKFPMLAEWIFIDDGLSRRSSRQRLNANTRYYLLKILGDYSVDTTKHVLIISAYRYIYEKISEAETSAFDRTRKMLDYIKFDVINDIFYRKNNSSVQLIKNIYEALEPVMNTNSQFKHQRAKSILWISEDDINEIQKAIEYVELAYHNTKTMLKSNNNRFLNISLGHICYTRALLYGRVCALESYSNQENIEKSLACYEEALLNPINSEELEALRAQKTDRRIKKDLQKIIEFALKTVDIDSKIIQTAQNLQKNIKHNNDL